MKNTFTSIAMALISSALLLPSAQAAGNGVRVEHLGTNNTLVRVEGEGKYLLLPVQDNHPDAKVNVIVDGKIDKTIFVRLAKNKVDFTVPLDLTPYKGKNVVLNVVTDHDRSSLREASDDACWTRIEVADTFDTANRDKYRPAFHHTPLYGWMNDPNGMVYKDGVWHLCYQYNPYGSKWQNMTWGQSTSRDLIHWDHQPLAIEANGLGAVFSGSSAIDHENSAGFGKDAIVTLYTSADVSQMQSLAWSEDGGYTYNIYDGNPVITLPTEARDPNMFWNPEKREWVMVLAHALEHEMLVFTSPDMKNWTLQNRFGKGLGAQDGVWECPDLFPLTIDGKQKWVLLCNLNPGGPFGGSATQYFIGDFDGTTFTGDTDAQGNVPTKWLDYGKDHYATVTWSDAPDHRRTAIGWMSNWQYATEVPTLQFRSANTLPRDMGLFRAADGELYVSSAPSPEVDALRDRLVKKSGGANVGQKPMEFALPTANEGICEILVTLDGRKAQSVNLTLSNKEGEKVDMIYDVKAHTMAFDRTKSGITDFSQEFPAVTVSPTFEADGTVSLRIFVDRSSIELFGDGGRFVMTNLVFPTVPYSTLSVSATGGQARIDSLAIYALTPTV